MSGLFVGVVVVLCAVCLTDTSLIVLLKEPPQSILIQTGTQSYQECFLVRAFLSMHTEAH